MNGDCATRQTWCPSGPVGVLCLPGKRTSELAHFLICSNGSWPVVEEFKYENIKMCILKFVPGSKCSANDGYCGSLKSRSPNPSPNGGGVGKHWSRRVKLKFRFPSLAFHIMFLVVGFF